MVPLTEVLKKRFGSDFPVGAGSTNRDDPLVITDQRDYVSIEYVVAKFLLEEMGFEYKFEKQQVHNIGGRTVDELIFSAKEPGESDWTQRRRFFFDITSGFQKVSVPVPYDGFSLVVSKAGEEKKPTSEMLRDELLAFASHTLQDGAPPKSHLSVLKSDGSQFVFQIGQLNLTGAQRLDLIRYLLFTEKAVAYALSFRVGVKVGGDVGVVERLAVFSADNTSFAAGELTLNSKDEGGANNRILESTALSPSYEFQSLLDGAFTRKKVPAWQRLMGSGKDGSEWKDEWDRLRPELHWLRTAT